MNSLNISCIQIFLGERFVFVNSVVLAFFPLLWTLNCRRILNSITKQFWQIFTPFVAFILPRFFPLDIRHWMLYTEVSTEQSTQGLSISALSFAMLKFLCRFIFRHTVNLSPLQPFIKDYKGNPVCEILINKESCVIKSEPCWNLSLWEYH